MTIHSSSDNPMWRSAAIDGSATLTTVLSSMIMKSPKETAPRVHHFRASSEMNWSFMVSAHYVSDH